MNTNYQMWLTFDSEKQKIQLPVLPESFQVTNGSKNSTLDIAGLGEITILQSRPAMKISFSSFFPAASFPGLKVSSITEPLKLIKKINEWKSKKKPVHFICTACGVDMYCSIETFTYTENGGDVGTYQYKIELKEYREITTRQINISGSSASVSKSSAARVDNSSNAQTYTVKSGDCLWNIAKKFYGDGSKYTKIYEANKSTIGSNPNLIYAGQVLSIPS